mgnify:CR=1 FL=1
MMFSLAFLLVCGMAFAVPQVQITNDDGSTPVNVTVDGKLEVSAELDPVTVDAVNIKNIADQEINPAKEDGNLATLAGGVTASKYQVNVTNTSVPISVADGLDVTLGAKADDRSTATDTTAASIMSVLKQISYMEQNPVSRYVTNTGLFPVDLNPPANMGSGQTTVTTAGTRVALAGSQACLSVTVKAKKTNTGLIYVGTAAAVSSSVGFILSPGETVTVDVDNLADVGLDSSVNAEGVSYIYAIK